ncbi:Uncharacterized protein GBIM_06018 [Gryllus bimaculatus]|nr:Uncharacterized protein GBIM_06018 [Gryllus bimaculatus]
MLKFIRGKGQQPSAERQKLQRELFAFRKTVQHGFPNKPTSLAWDPALRLLAVGTASGAIKIFGKPGVEFYGQHSNHESAVTKIVFVPNEGRLVSLCDDNSLHLWEVNGSILEEVKEHSLEGKLKKISALCLESAREHLLLGTEGGNIYLLNLKTFNMSETIIYQDVVMQNVPEDYKINPGAVEAIAEQPGCPDKILIGYNRGLMVLWDRKAPGADQTYISSQQLESICWHKSGSRFTSSHNDGSYAVWDVGVGEKPLEEPNTIYGPFPCKAVTKFLWRQSKGDDYILFAGGMPRASYSDRHAITVQQGKKHVVFDFTSKIVDFFTIAIEGEDPEFGEPDTLIVLLEEELVAIDLLSEDWKMLSLPYLVSLHASAVTCSQHISNVPVQLWEDIISAGKKQVQDLYSTREWPITGGVILSEKENGKEDNNEEPEVTRNLLLTGHEDGTVRFWNASGIALQPLYKFASAGLFSGDEIGGDGSNGVADDDEEEWPPFRKVGTFDPYSDDPRLAVKKVVLCPLTGTLVVAGTAGSVIVAKIGSEQVEKEVKVTTMNVVSDRDGFVWKGHDQLTPRSGNISLPPGFQSSAILQLHPPAAVTALVLHSEWGLAAAGTAHGLALFDFVRHKGVLTKCTLNPNDLSGAGDAPISRRKSFKKSLRESFRRLRKGRSTRHADKRGTGTSPTAEKKRDGLEFVVEDDEGEEEEVMEKQDSIGGGDASTPSSAPLSPVEPKPVERQVEARPVDDGQGSMVRCLYFARTYIISVQSMTPTLWAGTNNGTVFVFTITVPGGQKRTEEDVSCQLGKEIQLKHRAPVISVSILDGASVPLPDPLEVERGLAKQVDTGTPHRVVICSEEQFKIFTLPSLKPFCKFKLTAHEGSRVRRVGFAAFSTSRPDSSTQYTESCLLCLTNLGDCIVLSVPELRRQLNAAVIRREDINDSVLGETKRGDQGLKISGREEGGLQNTQERDKYEYFEEECSFENGISSLTFTKNGEAFYLHSSSELQRITLSASTITQPRCCLELPEGARPKATETDEEDMEDEDEDEEEGDEEKGDEGKIEGRESAAPSPTAQEVQAIPPTVNGDTDHAEPIVQEPDEPKENGTEEDRHDMSALSVGDITIDSVKDHLMTSSEENRITEIKNERLEFSTRTETQSVVKTTVISSGTTISSRKAPLAKMEDLEIEITM